MHASTPPTTNEVLLHHLLTYFWQYAQFSYTARESTGSTVSRHTLQETLELNAIIVLTNISLSNTSIIVRHVFKTWHASSSSVCKLSTSCTRWPNGDITGISAIDKSVDITRYAEIEHLAEGWPRLDKSEFPDSWALCAFSLARPMHF